MRQLCKGNVALVKGAISPDAAATMDTRSHLPVKSLRLQRSISPRWADISAGRERNRRHQHGLRSGGHRDARDVRLLRFRE